MKWMNSIRTQLVVWLVVGAVLLEFLAGAGLFAYVEETLEHSLDATLLARAQTVTAAVHLEDDGQPHLRLSNINDLRQDTAFFYQIWRADGSTLARFAPPNNLGPLPKPRNPKRRFGDVELPDDTDWRAIQLNFTPHPDEDEAEDTQHPLHPEQLFLVVLHDRQSTDQTLAVLLTGLSLVAVVVTIGIVAIVTWGVRRGLHPLAEVAKQVDQIGPQSLDIRVATTSLPTELLPVGEELNDLLERLQSAFNRERRFSADVAHELRTPVAELRTLCEVSLRWPDQNISAEPLSEALNIAMQMDSTIAALLSLVRCQTGMEQPARETVELSPLLELLWEPLMQTTNQKNLSVQWAASAKVQLLTDKNMLSLLLRNLLANAIQHSPPQGIVRIETSLLPTVAKVSIGNTNVSLQLEDLPHLFEPFWRKEFSRTDHLRQGLGLAIVKEYCDALGIVVQPSLAETDWFQIQLTIPLDRSTQ